MAAPATSHKVRVVVVLGCAGTLAAGCGLSLQGSLALEDDAGTDSTGSPSGSTPFKPTNDASSPFSGHSGTGSGSGVNPRGEGGGDPPGNEAGSGSGAGSGSSCDFSGTWATKITINVSWVPQGINSVIIAKGSGQIQQWVKGVRTLNGTATTDSTTICGVTLPDFKETPLVGGETYGVRFPDSLFDGDYLAPYLMQGMLSDLSPHASYTTQPSPALLGLNLANAATATWPSPVTTTLDTEHDGLLGVTVTAATGPIPDGTGNYSNFPIDLTGDRANRLGLVIRQVTQLSGAAIDCDHISGSVTIPKLPDTADGKYAIDSHVVDCRFVDGTSCQAQHISFIDNTQPIFSPNAGANQATFVSTRLPAGASCATVRQALP